MHSKQLDSTQDLGGRVNRADLKNKETGSSSAIAQKDFTSALDRCSELFTSRYNVRQIIFRILCNFG